MWLFTDKGFYSVVTTDDGGDFMIRGRVRRDLEALLPLLEPFSRGREVLESRQADYRYRLVVDADEWVAVAAELAAGIDYANFKSRIAEIDPARADAYHEIWEVHYSRLPLEDIRT